MMKPILSVLFFLIGLCVPVLCSGQVPTELYVFKLQKVGNVFHVYQPALLSGFNPGGYTNQPFFTPEGDILVSVRFVDDQQNDIYRLSPDSRQITRLTQTSSNEYSPRLDPSNAWLSVLRQAEGDSIDQQVFYSKLNGGGYKTLTPDRRDIGYYTWLDSMHLALLRLEEASNRLERYSLEDHTSRKITSSVGRTLWTDKDGSVLYVHKFSTDFWYIKRYNADAFRMDIVAQTPGTTEDFALAPDGTFFMGYKGKLYSFHPDRNDQWITVADLTMYGIENVTRLAISQDGSRLALVSPKEMP